MATHVTHHQKNTFYFVTFTCHKWISLIEITSLYDFIPSWISQISARGIKTSGYVVMPNHIHLLLYVTESSKGLNHVIGESKRFLAYEIVKRLKKLKRNDILKILADGVHPEEQKIGKKHQVFRLSFDAKELLEEKEIERVLDYIHHNPVSGKWNLVDDYTKYPHSSASWYELGEQGFIDVWDYRKEFSESPTDDSERV